MSRNCATVRAREGEKGECVPRCRTPSYDGRGGASTGPCALTLTAAAATMTAAATTMAAAAATMAAAAATMMAAAATMAVAAATMAVAAATMMAGQSRWPRRQPL